MLIISFSALELLLILFVSLAVTAIPPKITISDLISMDPERKVQG